MSWRSVYRKIPVLSTAVPLYLGWKQDRMIDREQREYEEKAIQKGLVSGEEDAGVIFQRLKIKLAQRGITWPPRTDKRPLHILYLSFPGVWEAHNIPPELEKIGEVSLYYLIDRGIARTDNISEEKEWIKIREHIAADLPAFVSELHKKKPVDLILSYFSGSHIYPHTIRQIGEMGIPVFSFHWDDRMSFIGKMIGSQRSGPYAVCKAYDLNLSNSIFSMVKYRVEGGEALFWPEGANPEFFKPLDLPFKYDVSFIGVKYGRRPQLINYLRKNGIKVACFGTGWENGFISTEEMVKVYAQSRINLGFGQVVYSSDQCLKGRDFEVPSCAAVYLTSYNKNIDRVYRVGEEIEVYRGGRDCVEKIKYLLANPEKCIHMRSAARQAVLNKHSWSNRVRQLLKCTGVPKI